MKTIGLIGGMSWESTQIYYKLINERVNAALGGLHSAQIILCSVDFAPIEAMQASGQWREAGGILGDAARRLEQAGADFIVICTNTMHMVAPEITSHINIPLLHIARATVEALHVDRINRIGLLGTTYTMSGDFYKDKLRESGIDIVTPDSEDMAIVNAVIFRELCKGIVKEASRTEFQRIIGKLASKGAQGIVLGCTEIGMLLKQGDIDLPVYDTTIIHAQAAADMALNA